MRWANPWRKLATASQLSGYQPLDSDLTAVAALTTTAYGRALLELANQAALMALLDADLQEIANQANVAGDILYTDATPSWVRLAKGSDGDVLTLASGLPSWAATSGGGMSLIDSEQPATDVATVSLTGFSGKSLAIIQCAFKPTSNNANLLVRGRVAAGTYRSFGNVSTGINNAAVIHNLLMVISGIGLAQEKSVSIFTNNALATLDSSDAMNVVQPGAIATEAGTAGAFVATFAFPSFDEAWDEIELSFDTGSIEGSTADQRGFAYGHGA